MKKFIGLFLVSVLLISGCSGSNDEKSVACTLEMEGSTLEYDFGYDSDEKIKTIKGTITLESEEEMDDSQMEMLESVYSSMFDKIEGVDYELSSDEKNKKKVTIAIDIDLDKYDAEEDALGMFATVSDKDDISDLKVSDMVKGFELAGGKCGEIK